MKQKVTSLRLNSVNTIKVVCLVCLTVFAVMSNAITKSGIQNNVINALFSGDGQDT